LLSQWLATADSLTLYFRDSIEVRRISDRDRFWALRRHAPSQCNSTPLLASKLFGLLIWPPVQRSLSRSFWAAYCCQTFAA
jgi:hypothetical protein